MIILLVVVLVIWGLILQENMALDREKQILEEDLKKFQEASDERD